jgi:hypothetical protein
MCLKECRTKMLENLLAYLKDDCYLFLMTYMYSKFLEAKSKGNMFIIVNLHLESAFVDRLSDLYTNLQLENKVNYEYNVIVQSCIEKINSEKTDIIVSFNNTKTARTYEILFLANPTMN